MHHAYLYEGSLSLREALEQSARALLGFTKAADPDVHIYEQEKLTIEEARELVGEASFKTVSGRGLFIIAAESISSDAQQALLKLLEEPQEGVTFVILTPPGLLLPTLRSRMVEYPEKLEHIGDTTLAKKFLASAYKERSAQISMLIKEEEGVKERVREFLSGLESIFHKKIKAPEARVALGDIALVRKYMSDRSASLKMLLEHLAAVLPQI